MHFEELFRAGILPISTVGDPGTHGAGITGRQGIGVKMPSAAAVAAATIGLAMLMHIPNGMTLANGLLSMMFAAGIEAIIVLFVGATTSVDGAAPIVHKVIAPMTTGIPISRTVALRRDAGLPSLAGRA